MIVVLFGYAFSWISALIGLLVKDTESVQAAGFIWIFPLTFASSAFVPVDDDARPGSSRSPRSTRSRSRSTPAGRC